ncbi:MAG: serine/threonine-protein kinase [Anaerolineales bacterium]|nr:serine/threonine-protein kinase [Anaerolineales bacterium]
MSLNPGDLLRNRYRITGIIGKGGMGAVYRGEDSALQTTVAIKENLNPLPQAVKQFKREAVLLASLRHPNLPRVTDHFIEGDLQYLIMDYIPGDDLKTILERQGAVSESQVVGWCREICDALTYLHTQHPPVTHRDIKPANIKIMPDGKPVLVDFGIAKATEVGGATTTGARSLTPGFAPPEQYGSSPTDSRSDQYSLAATLYNLLTGHIPPDSLERALEQTELKPIREWNPKISPAVDASIWKAMSLSPSERFLSVKNFFEALSGDTELSILPQDMTKSASREALTVIRRTPEKTTKEKSPPAGPSPEETPAQGRKPPAVLWAGIGAILCLAATGLAVGGYALSGGWPPASKSPSTPAVRRTAVAVSLESGSTQAVVLPFEDTATPTPSLAPSPTVTRTPTPEPTPVGGSRLLAFVSNRAGGTYQIFTYNLATGEIAQVTSDPVDKGRLAWSPDGKYLYYEAKVPGGTTDIFRINADGSEPQNLTDYELNDLYPAPSPNGDRIAFVSKRNGYEQIYWMAADGAGAINVSAKHDTAEFHQPEEWDPAWSPDGMLLYFTVNITGWRRVYRWNTLDPTRMPVIVTVTAGDYWEGEPAVSPSGEYVAYTRRHNDGGSDICIGVTDLTKRMPCTEPLTDRRWNSDPDWSPDGGWIAFTSRRNGKGDIYRIMISGSGETRLTDDPADDLYPAWQPAGGSSA